MERGRWVGGRYELYVPHPDEETDAAGQDGGGGESDGQPTESAESSADGTADEPVEATEGADEQGATETTGTELELVDATTTTT